MSKSDLQHIVAKLEGFDEGRLKVARRVIDILHTKAQVPAGIGTILERMLIVVDPEKVKLPKGK